MKNQIIDVKRNAMIDGPSEHFWRQTVKETSNAISIVQLFSNSNALIPCEPPFAWTSVLNTFTGYTRIHDVIPVNAPKTSEARVPSCVAIGSCISHPMKLLERDQAQALY